MIRKLLVAGAVVAGVVALGAGPAFAHMEIEREGEVGSNGVVTAQVTVPNEEAPASTTQVELVFPGQPALTNVQPTAVPGWTATVQKSASGNVTGIVWAGGKLSGTAKVVFPFTLGPIPADTTTITFKGLQTYDNGTVVRWIEPTPAGGPEPEHPSPVLIVRGKQVSDAAPSTGGSSHAAATQTTKSSNSDSGMSTGAILAIVIGVIIVVALVVWLVVRSRRRTKTPTA
jgi:uncharacterized protein YcnI